MKRSFKSTLKRIEVQVIFQVTPNFARFCAVCSNYLINPQNPFVTLILLMGGILHILNYPPTFKTQPMHVFAPRTKSTKNRTKPILLNPVFVKPVFLLPMAGHPSSPCCKRVFSSFAHSSSCLGMKKVLKRTTNGMKTSVAMCLLVIG